MELIKVVQSSGPLARLTEKRFTNFGVARRLAAMKSAVLAEVAFFAKQQNALVAACAERDEQGRPVMLDDSHVKLEDPALAAVFEQEMQDLMATEVDLPAPVVVRETDFRSVDDIPTPDEICALAGVVDFVEG